MDRRAIGDFVLCREGVDDAVAARPGKNYIYMGDRLIAEYDHVGGRFLYYTPDQINSTRIVTDDTGTVVYSAAHDPYGGIQQTWVNTFDPMPKFSGKERDEESQLDYFGARYYDKAQYRFISVDPKVTRRLVQLEPQKWNFYSFCFNNPISLPDPTGQWPTLAVHYSLTYSIAIFVGLPQSIAESISLSCANVDINPATTAGTANVSTWGSAYENALNGTIDTWHFPGDERLNESLRICQTILNLEEFGKNLHVIQDSFTRLSPISNRTPITPFKSIDYGRPSVAPNNRLW